MRRLFTIVLLVVAIVGDDQKPNPGCGEPKPCSTTLDCQVDGNPLVCTDGKCVPPTQPTS